ncbi:MAG: YHS domain protein [Chitinophagaceae bacterium]|nr:YHS domain protein [Chitinophagaceae bacterium]
MKTLVFFIGCMLASVALSAQKSEVFKKDNIAINGYDAVAYFTESKPIKGDPQFVFQWKDTNWHFESEKNMQAFKENPDKYAPQYGGYCAYGTAGGHKAPTDPSAWKIINEKLYLNYNNQVRTLWLKDTTGHINKADSNWHTIKHKQ